MTRQITPENVVEYLAARGVLATSVKAGGLPAAATVTELSGGVSGRCIMVSRGSRRVVVKQALPQLSVAAVWTAKTERALTEAAALRLVHTITPASTPAVIDVDADLCAFTMSAAPADYVSWKDLLLAYGGPDGQIQPVAERLGTLLGGWHRRTWHRAEVAAEFADYEAFEQLRVTPFHRVVAAMHPTLGSTVHQCIDELLGGRDCLVHGDFSPKNVLVGRADPWVVDFEVAHVGAAVFDLAFMQCHLMLKALHQPGRAGVYGRAAAAFLDAYAAANPAAGRATEPERRLGWHTACLLLARVDGTSPATYLTEPERAEVRSLARATLSRAPAAVSDLWRQAQGVRS